MSEEGIHPNANAWRQTYIMVGLPAEKTTEEKLTDALAEIARLNGEVRRMEEWGRGAWNRVGELHSALDVGHMEHEKAIAKAKAAVTLSASIKSLTNIDEEYPDPEY